MFNKVTLRVLNAELVRDPNLIMKMDPYCVVRTSRAETKTSVSPNAGKHPRWNESFNLDVTGDNSIYIAIFDQESVGKDNAIAETFINLNQLQDTNGVIARSYPLTYKGKNAGELFVEIQLAGSHSNLGSQEFSSHSNQAYIAPLVGHQANLAAPIGGQNYMAPPIGSQAYTQSQVTTTTVTNEPGYNQQYAIPSVHGQNNAFVAPVVGTHNVPVSNQVYAPVVGQQAYLAAPLASAIVYDDRHESKLLKEQYKVDERLAKDQTKATDHYLREQHKSSDAYMKEQEKIANSSSKIETKYMKEREKSMEREHKIDQQYMKEREKVEAGFGKIDHSRERQIAKNEEQLVKLDIKAGKERIKQEERLHKVEEKHQMQLMKEQERHAKSEVEHFQEQAKLSSGHVPVGYVAPIPGAYIAPVHGVYVAPVPGAYVAPVGPLTHDIHYGNNTHNTPSTGHITTGRLPSGHIETIVPTAGQLIGQQYGHVNTEVSKTEVIVNPDVHHSSQHHVNQGVNQVYAQAPLTTTGAPYQTVAYASHPVDLKMQNRSRSNSRDRSAYTNTTVNTATYTPAPMNPIPTTIPYNQSYGSTTTTSTTVTQPETHIIPPVHHIDHNLNSQMANLNLPPQTYQQSIPVNTGSIEHMQSEAYRNLYGKAIVKIIRAEVTRDPNLIAKMDPYALVRTKAIELRTHVAEGAGKNPVWNAIFDIELRGDSMLYIGLWDRDTFSADHIIADISFDLRGNMQNENRFVGWQPLYYKGNNVGRIFIELEYYPNAPATNLPVTYAQDNNAYVNINRDQFNNYAPASGYHK